MKNTATLKIVTAVVVSGLMLTGCNTTNERMGATTGAVLGGVIGHQFGKGRGKTAATIAGTIIGSQIGGNIGAQMDARDRQYVNNAVYSGQQTSWQNQQTGHRYTATPGNVYNANYQGQQTVCRPVTVVGYINGQQQNIQMNACRDSSGQWQATQ
ncbi:MAG: glycine zipper 2TM domain-containing protein [Thiolinea sp.]